MCAPFSSGVPEHSGGSFEAFRNRSKRSRSARLPLAEKFGIDGMIDGLSWLRSEVRRNKSAVKPAGGETYGAPGGVGWAIAGEDAAARMRRAGRQAAR